MVDLARLIAARAQQLAGDGDDAEGTIAYVNSAMAGFMGLDREAIVGRPVGEHDSFTWGRGLLSLIAEQARIVHGLPVQDHLVLVDDLGGEGDRRGESPGDSSP